MATKSVEFNIEIADFDADALKRLKEARASVEKVEAEILNAYRDSDRLMAIRDLTGLNDFAHKFSVRTRIHGNKIVASTTVELGEDKTTAYVPPLNLGEKTLNALITGNLLTGDQKKALLKRIGVDLDTLTETAGA